MKKEFRLVEHKLVFKFQSSALKELNYFKTPIPFPISSVCYRAVF
jgi:hypothetical protein